MNGGGACETNPVFQSPRPLVTLEGYYVEGGFDRAYEPQTCYAPSIALGRHAGPGEAESLWRDYEHVLEMVADVGLAGVRLGIEWARIEPRRGEVDATALARYGEVVAHARGLDLEVDVTLVDAAWPSWLGLEAWLLPWVVPHVIEHARRLAGLLAEVDEANAVGIVIFAERRRLVDAGYLEGAAPPWRTDARVDAQFARSQLDLIEGLLGEDALVGPRLVPRFSTLSLDAPPTRVVSWREQSGPRARLYARTLLRGHGPSATAPGLLERRSEGFRVVAPGELLDALR